MLVHGISCACTPQNIVLRQCFYSAKTKSKNTKMITLGFLPISAKFNVLRQTHLSSSSPKTNVVIIMNQNLMHDKKIPQDQNHNYPCYE